MSSTVRFGDHQAERRRGADPPKGHAHHPA